MNYYHQRRRSPNHTRNMARYQNAAAAKCPHCAFYLFLNGSQIHFPEQCPAKQMSEARAQRTERGAR